jgi:hypothetical protein
MKESDWKLLSSKKDELLNELCENIINEIETVSKDTTKTFHQRYGSIYGLIRDRDRKIADIFNRWSRSQFDSIVIQMIREGLLDKNMAGFSDETRDRIQSFL